MTIDRPIFVVGPHRCGTTLFYGCLASHPDVGFFNRADGNFPDHPRIAWWITRLGLVRDTPRESRRIWTRFLGGRPDDLAGAGDATPEARRWYEERIDATLRLRRASRFASKYPAHSAQVPYVAALFPDALFVQMVRDWRAVVSSTMVKRARDFPGEWFGVRMPGWPEAARLPDHLGAAWQYRAVHEHLDEQRALHADRFLQIRYEELVARPLETMRTVWTFCGLRQSAAIDARLPTDIRPAHDRWRETLTSEKIAEIESVHGGALRRYEVAAPPVAAR